MSNVDLVIFGVHTSTFAKDPSGALAVWVSGRVPRTHLGPWQHMRHVAHKLPTELGVQGDCMCSVVIDESKPACKIVPMTFKQCPFHLL